ATPSPTNAPKTPKAQPKPPNTTPERLKLCYNFDSTTTAASSLTDTYSRFAQAATNPAKP
ncbi:MAG: hypothetical protein OXI96_01675, partial [Acidimicrobiaceae bacterium]|nr:hypothetical protein [Acidimicrobiaceae bacterium]